MTTEHWKDIAGFEGRYQVSDLGRVRSLAREVRAVSKAGREYTRCVPSVVLAPGLSRGYQIVNLSPKGTVAVHLLVARAFVEGHAAGLEVNHIDGVKGHNAAANLEWVTRKENLEHAVRLGLNTQAIPVLHPDSGCRFPSIAQAAKQSCCNHRTVASQWGRA